MIILPLFYDGPSLDIPFPTKIRNELIAAGRAQPHHLLPDTGWISFYLRADEDVQHAIDLLRLSYEIALKQKARGQVTESNLSTEETT